MLDAVVAFTRGGEVLWRWKGSGSKQHSSGAATSAASTNAPLDALVRSCLLEDRTSEASFAWDAPGAGGGAYTLKWSLHNVRQGEKEKKRIGKERERCHRSSSLSALNLDRKKKNQKKKLKPTFQGLGLVVVAIYQRALRLPYVDNLLQATTEAFAQAYRASKGDENDLSSSFDATFEELADAAERSAASGAAGTTSKASKKNSSSASLSAVAAAAEEDADEDEEGDEAEEEEGANGNGGGSAINLEAAAAKMRLKKGGKKKGGGSSGSLAAGGGGGTTQKAPPAPKAAKEARVWQGQARKGAALEALDFSEGKPPVGFAAAAAAAAGEDEGVDFTAKSRVDAEEEEESDDDAGFVFDDEPSAASAAAAGRASGKAGKAAAAAPKKAAAAMTADKKPSSTPSALSSFVRSLGLSLAGSAALTDTDVEPALDSLKKKLMERNVAEPVAGKVCASVRASIVGSQHASFTRVASAVRAAVEEALERILTPR